ncbi:MAG TPA: hypothetical protein VFE33_28935 [Thermoanaerobaculia bacterium]|nr:hypothetical protein [Thermoanaerobaculia bacterium]
MQKKLKKPLKLTRETLAALDRGELEHAVGMVTQIKNQCLTQAATFCTCHVINTHCIAG